MHQINLERMSPVHAVDGVAFPDTLVGTDSHTPMVDALGVIQLVWVVWKQKASC